MPGLDIHRPFPSLAGVWRPRDNNLLASNAQPSLAIQVGALTSGTYLFSRVKIPAGVKITNLHTRVFGAGAGLTYAAAAVYEANGAKAGETASQTTAWQSAGEKVMALGTPIAAKEYDRYVWVGLAAAGTTVPSMAIVGYVSASNLGSPSPFAAGYIAGAAPLPASVTLSSLINTYEFVIGVS